MKNSRLFLAVAVFVLASLACQTVTGGGSPQAPSFPSGGIDGTVEPGDTGGAPTPSDSSGGGSSKGSTDFPMPSDASDIFDFGSDTVNFQTKMTLDESMAFYRKEYGKQGFTERAIQTVTSKSTFSMVFDGHASGKALVVQGVDLGDGTTNISIRLEDA
jgi:hypothetical protein